MFFTIICCINARAYDFKSGELYYNITFNNMVEVTRSIDYLELTNIIIPDSVTSSGEKYVVKSIGVQAFSNCDNLTSVTLPNTLSHIGDSAFSNCKKLRQITIPATVISIGKGAFYNIANVNYLGEAYYDMPWGAMYLNSFLDGDYIFSDKEKTKLIKYIGEDSIVNIPNSTIYVAPNTFDLNKVKQNKYGKSYYLGNTENPYYILVYGYDSIINSNCKIIGPGAFQMISDITSIEIPEGVKSIGAYAFNYCFNLKNLIIPNSVTIFEGPINCSDLQYNEYDNGLYLGNEENPYLVLNKVKSQSITSCEINKRCRFISDAFMGCRELESIVIPDSVVRICPWAFDGCVSLKSITIPDAVTLAHYSILRCRGLETVTVGKHAVIEYSAFCICDNLRRIIIEDSLISISRYALDEVYNVEYIICKSTIPPVLFGDPFSQLNTIYVPSESIDSYKTAPFWKNKNFKPYICNVDVTSNDSTCGTVVGSGSYIVGDDVEITAKPAEHCHFVNWSDGSTRNPRYIEEVTDSLSLVANFEKDKYWVLVTGDNGKIIGNGIYNYGDTATLIPLPDSGYHFLMWSDSVTINPRNYLVPDNTYLSAIFTEHIPAIDSAVAATCTETGLTEGKHCLVCNEILVAQDTIAALGHTEVVNAAVAATCTETGLTEGKHCSVCNEILVAQDTIAALGHTEVIDAAVATTCTETGLTEGKHCSVCNEIIVAQDTIAALGHTEVIDAAVAATCTETGLTEGKHCSVCNEVLVAQTEIPALGHEFVNYVYNKDATTTADGTETATCERGCGATDTRVAEGTKLSEDHTTVSESVANAINIYAHGRTIVVENATEEIRVYDAMGRLVGRDVARNVIITVKGTGVYIVKTGGVVKRVKVNW